MKIEKDDLTHFFDAIHQRYGYNFNGYLKNSLRRRLSLFLLSFRYNSLEECLAHILEDERKFYTFLSYTLVSVTEFFRDPSFFTKFIAEVIPQFHSYPYIKIWHAGCASGEEVYSMAILLKELGLSKK